MQGGLHPDFNIEWYEDLLRMLHARYPKFQLHCFSPPEIHNIHLISGLDYVTIMQRLKDAGLNSLPGGGGEILDDEVRQRVSTKCTTQEWLDVMRAVHKVGLISTATIWSISSPGDDTIIPKLFVGSFGGARCRCRGRGGGASGACSSTR